MAETQTFEAAAFTAQGTSRERVPLPATVFDGTVNMPVMHQAVKAYLSNQRQGTASTKTRGKVAGGNQKPWKQKGTGRARQGSTRAPNWVGGGTVFGPHGDRNYHQTVPRQVRQLARRSAFNARARENAILVIDRFEWDAPKTQRMLALLQALDVAGRKVLILTDGVKPNVYLSARNLPRTHVMPYGDVSTYELLWSDVVLIESSAIGEALEPKAEAEWTPNPAKQASAAARSTPKKAPAKKAAAKKAASRKTASSAKSTKAKSAKKTAKKAAKKAAAKSTAKKQAKSAAKSVAKKTTKKTAAKKKSAASRTKRK
ncbi:MAG TPA: 50S ribosomal protein L4 [Gemmatimonadaceae bacterium]|nr:50S ribosomal protein L4 [Gemmatimonadaceae bacterium]